MNRRQARRFAALIQAISLTPPGTHAQMILWDEAFDMLGIDPLRRSGVWMDVAEVEDMAVASA